MSLIGFVGLGTMGAPMAHNLIRAGHQLRVYDVNPGVCQEAAALGAVVCSEPSDVLAEADYVISMLPNGNIVSNLLGGKAGLLAHASTLGARPLFIDCSTISPLTARAMADEAAAHGLDFVDAPVSGGVARACDGTLTIMVGGSQENYARAQGILSAVAQSVFHAGDIGAGQSAKICNNMVAAVIMAGTAEALALGEKLGLDPGRLSQIMAKSSGGSFLLDRWNPYPNYTESAPSSRNYENGFQLQLMLKDLGLALSAAQSMTAPVPMGAAAQSLYALKAQEGAETRLRDFSIVVELFRDTQTASSNH